MIGSFFEWDQMYPSILMLPLPIAICTVLNRRVVGPYRMVMACESISAWIRRVVPERAVRIAPEDVDFEMKCLRHIVPRKLGNCIEISMVLQVWLAFHGQNAKISVGKRIDGESIAMHAWLEPDGFGRNGWSDGVVWSDVQNGAKAL